MVTTEEPRSGRFAGLADACTVWMVCDVAGLRRLALRGEAFVDGFCGWLVADQARNRLKAEKPSNVQSTARSDVRFSSAAATDQGHL